MAVMQSHLPYDRGALEPHVSRKTMSYHYDEHHSGYVKKLNDLIEGTDYDSLSLEQIVSKARANGDTAVFNNAAQAWNHGFFWKSMSPNGGGTPQGKLKEMIDDQYPDFDVFKQQLRDAALGQFGSGWAWLVLDNDKIRITTTGNAETPLGTNVVPLLTMDVWEHAYYLDYQNVRKSYVEAFIENLVNWEFAAANLAGKPAIRAA